MDQAQPISGRRMLLWSLAVIAGICLLALFVRSEPTCRPPAPKTNSQHNLQVSHWNTSLQTPVYFIRTPDTTFLDIQILFDAGTARDGATAGLACLTSRLIGKETEARTAEDVVTGFENHGAIFHSACNLQTLQISLRTPVDKIHLQPSLSLLREVISQPLFHHKQLIRQKSQMLCELQQKETQQEHLAYRRLREVIYKDHPYGQPQEGSHESLNSLSIENVQAFFEQYFSARNMIINLVGNISREQAEQIGEQFSLALPAGEKARPVPEPEPPIQSIAQHLPDSSSNTVSLIGALAIPCDDPDYPAYYLTSRLLRQLMNSPDCFAQTLSCELVTEDLLFIKLRAESDLSRKKLYELHRSLETFFDQGPTLEQLSYIKKAVKAELSPGYLPPRALLADLRQLSYLSLPLDDRESLARSIDGLTREEIKQVLVKVMARPRRVLITTGKKPE